VARLSDKTGSIILTSQKSIRGWLFSTAPVIRRMLDFRLAYSLSKLDRDLSEKSKQCSRENFHLVNGMRFKLDQAALLAKGHLYGDD
jgi:hypothetical protein